MNDMSQRGRPLGVPPKITTVDFHGAKLLAIAGDSPATTMVAMKPVCEAMGLNWGSQHTKIKDHPVLSGSIAIIAIPSTSGDQATSCLSLEMLPMWLATINTNKLTNPALQARVILFQKECAKALSAYFFGHLTPASELDIRTNGIVRMLANKVTGLERMGEINTKSLHALSGIMKSYVQTQQSVIEQFGDMSKSIAELRNQLTLVHVATEAHNPDRGFISPLEILEAMRVPEKGRRGLVSLVSSRLRSHCKAVKRPDDMKLSIATKRWVFSEELAQHWLGLGGRELINARRQDGPNHGQALLDLAGGKKRLPLYRDCVATQQTVDTSMDGVIGGPPPCLDS
jgi:hypothetical protein